MPDFSFVLYDTAPFGATAGTDHVLFQVSQGADSTHTEAYTNSRGAGQLPTEEKFLLKRLHAIIDHNTALADIPKIFNASYFELRVSDKIVFKCPLAMLSSKNSYGGHYTQAAAADEAVIGLDGEGYELEIPIEIQGGVSFRPKVYQGTAVTASSNIKIVLEGTLTMQ